MHDNDAESDTGRTDRLSPFRRDVMKVVGAGGALSVLGVSAAADEHDQDDDETGEDETDVEDDVETEDRTVHTVRTLIRPSTHPQRPADFFFEPTGIHVDPGDVLRFVFETPDHTVTSYHPAYGMRRRIPMGVAPFSSPVLGWDPASLPADVTDPPMEMEGPPGDPGEDGENGENGDVAGGEEEEGDGPRPSTWLHTFDEPGVYDLECAPHEAFGMAMRVVVGDDPDPDFETSDADELPPPRAGPVGFARLVLTDPSLEPDTIVDEGRVEWADLEMADADGPPGDGPPENGPPENGPPDNGPPENGPPDNGPPNGDDRTEDA